MRDKGVDKGRKFVDCGGGDKRHMTLLGLAAKLGRLKCLTALLLEFHATINEQVRGVPVCALPA